MFLVYFLFPVVNRYYRKKKIIKNCSIKFIGLVIVACHIFLSINNNDTITALISKVFCIILYSTTTADMLASLELDLKKVNVESGQLHLAAYMLVVFFFSPALPEKCFI